MAKQSTSTSKHDRANATYLKGDYENAIKLQVEVVNEQVEKGQPAVVARKLLALYLYSNKDYDAAVTLLKALAVELPDDSEIPENIGVMLRQAGQLKSAVEYLLKAAEMSPEKFNVCDALAHSFHTLKQPDQVQKFGRKSLELKDDFFKEGKKWPIPNGAPPAFNTQKAERNVISFSLFGDDPRYLHGALRNIRLAADLYPSWVCRFYCDPRVPQKVISEMKSHGCQVVMRQLPINFYEGLLWRFEVIDDPTIDRFLVRDCDSIINIKERVAVDEWLASDKWFHMMRDFSSHTELILAGMWGGVSGVLPTLEELDAEFTPKTAATRTYDQHLLREMVWPTMRDSVMIHDSVYAGCLGSIDFPAVGTLPPNRHVGQNEAAVIGKEDMVSLESNRVESTDQFFILGHQHSGANYLQSLLKRHPNVQCPPRHRLSAVLELNKKTTAKYEEIITQLDERSYQQGVELDHTKLQEELYSTWLEHLFVDYIDESTTHFGITDTELDATLSYHAQIFPEAKFIFVVRDPRDVAVALYQYRKKNDPGFDRDGSQLSEIARTVGETWAKKVRNVQKFNAAKPGRIELVRFEDLVAPNFKTSSLERVLKFLGLPTNDTVITRMLADSAAATLDWPEIEEWKDALSLNQVNLVEMGANPVMNLLQYQSSPTDHRAIEADDTILPS